jgi:hypothetical protein
MAVKSQANIDAGAGLALAGSRQKGVELATSAAGTNISGTDICEEFGHSGSGTGSDINVGSYHTGTGGLVPAAGNTSGLIAGSAAGEKQFSDYIGGAAISAPTTFAINRGDWNTTQQTVAGTSIFAEAFIRMRFQHQPAANRIRIGYAAGTSAGPSQLSFVNYEYVGLSGATWQVRYNVSSQSRSGDSVPAQAGCFQGSFGPTPVQDGYNSGTYYTLSGSSVIEFGWMAFANPNTFCQGAGTVVGQFADNVSSNIYAFQLKGTLGSDTFEAHAVYDLGFGGGGRIQDVIALSAGTNLPVPF